MPEALDPAIVLAPLVPALVPVPAVQPGVCRYCRTAVDSYAQCFKCHRAFEAFGKLPEVLPLAMSVDSGPLHARLRDYKRSGNREVRRRAGLQLGALLALGLRLHRGCIGDFDLVTTVPSAKGDSAAQLVRLISELRDLHTPMSYVRGTTRELDAGRFGAPPSMGGARVLLVDDTLTTGASVFSAVAALRSAGAEVVGPVVLARHLNPTRPGTPEMLAWLQKVPWNPQHCGRCGGVQNPDPRRAMF